jgi:hypothetical protein
MSTSNPTPQTAKPAVKPRSPVERLLVRGFIVVMLVLVAVEGWSWWSHKQARDKLFALTGAVDESNAPPVTETDVIAVIGGKKPVTEDVRGKPGSNGASRLDIYSWFTISPINKREVYVFYGYKGKADTGPAEVLFVQSQRDVPDESVKAQEVPKGNDLGAAPGLPGMGAGSAPGNMAPRGAAGRPGSGRPPAGDTAGDTGGDKEGDKSDAATPDSDNPTGDKATDDKPADDNAAAPASEKDPQ